MTKTPPELAKRYRVNPDKILALIASNELAAINVATNPNGRPRWRITPEAIADFEARRAAKPAKPATPKPKRRRRGTDKEIVEYV